MSRLSCSLADRAASYQFVQQCWWLFVSSQQQGCARRICDVCTIFSCKRLLLADLAWNHIMYLPSMVPSCSLVALNLSYNRLCDLTSTVTALSRLPALMFLRLKVLKYSVSCSCAQTTPTAMSGGHCHAGQPVLSAARIPVSHTASPTKPAAFGRQPCLLA